MGTAAGKTVQKVHIQEQLPGYRRPAPPTIYIDDMRPSIPWYQDNAPEDEFDWSYLSRDGVHQMNLTTWPSRASVCSTPRTPSSVIRASSGFIRSLTNKPTKTESGRRITFMNQERVRSSMQSRGPKSSVQGFRHRVAVPSEERLPFEKVDDHARNVGQQHLQSNSTLVSFLKEPFRYQQMRETLIARAIIVWLASQKPIRYPIGRAEMTSPKGLLLHITRGSMSHAEVYTVLCREAGLQCVLVEGLSKSGDYDDNGGTVTTRDDVWTAVYVDGSWQLVHPYWICKGLAGSGATYRDWIKSEVQKGKEHRKDIVRTLKETVKYFINEDFFMPAPEVFIYTCYADDNQWQLLSTEFAVASRDDFMSLPVIYPAFFRFGLLLTSESSCVLRSSSGVCQVSIMCQLENADRLVLSYNLILLVTEIRNPELVLENISKFVVNSRNENQFTIEVRFPIEGIFRLEISGGFFGSHQLRLCQFKLVCKERHPNFKYVPFSNEILAFGPGPLCDEFGLLLPSLPNGVVRCYRDNSFLLTKATQDDICFQPKEFMFKLDTEKCENTEFDLEFIGFASDDCSDEVSPYKEDGFLKDVKYMKSKLTEGKTLQTKETNHDFSSNCLRVKKSEEDLMATVVVPFDGEFALVIWATKFKVFKDGSYVILSRTAVCAYLLKTCTWIRQENVPQKLARYELERAIKAENIESLEAAIDKSQHVSMEQDADELVAARRKLEYLIFKRDAHYTIHRRNRRIIQELLKKLAKYQHKRTLVTQIRRLFSLQKQIQMLAECRHHLPELREALREIAEITEPPPEVHITVAAMFLALGEPEKHIDEWDFILQNIQSDSDSDTLVREDPPILRRVALVPDLDPPKTTRRKILSLLYEFDLETIEAASKGAAVISKWVKKVMAILENVDHVTGPRTETTT